MCRVVVNRGEVVVDCVVNVDSGRTVLWWVRIGHCFEIYFWPGYRWVGNPQNRGLPGVSGGGWMALVEGDSGQLPCLFCDGAEPLKLYSFPNEGRTQNEAINS